MGRELILQIENMSKTYPGVKALQGININIFKGQVHALVGANGAGKSTLIKILGGVLEPDVGSVIRMFGKEIQIRNAQDSVKAGISIIYQDLSLFQNLSVFENIAISSITDNKGIIDWKRLRKKVQEAINILKVDIRMDEIVGNLSMAKQQMVAIVRALAYDSKLIIMDEPTSALSKSEIKTLLEIICNLREKEISVMFVSHKLDELLQVCSAFTVLKDGKYRGTYEREEVNKEKLIKLMIGENVQTHQIHRTVSDTEILRVDKLSKRGNFKDISFSLKKGEILGITGIVGAGRSELAEAIFGVRPAESGEIYINGEKVQIRMVKDALKHKIAYVPEGRQTQGLLLKKSIMDNITLVNIKNLCNKWKLIDLVKKRKVAKEWIQSLNIQPSFEEMEVGQLSGGNQQRIVLAKWLEFKPDILIVDEPTNGVDVAAKKEICEIIRDMANEGISIIIISSELEEIFDYSDRIIVMRKGRISGVFSAEEANHELIMSRAVLENNSKNISA